MITLVCTTIPDVDIWPVRPSVLLPLPVSIALAWNASRLVDPGAACPCKRRRSLSRLNCAPMYVCLLLSPSRTGDIYILSLSIYPGSYLHLPFTSPPHRRL